MIVDIEDVEIEAEENRIKIKVIVDWSKPSAGIVDVLETNIPHTLMNYSDAAFPSGSSLFPKHVVVRQYLHDYAKDLVPLLSLSTQVLRVEKMRPNGCGTLP